MNEADTEPGGLSEDELRELLRAGLGDGAEEPGSSDSESRESGEPWGTTAEAILEPLPARVLLISRRSSDAALIGNRLQARGAAVEVVRNAFSALDKLRTGSYTAVVSDLDLWARNGQLLFDRIQALKAELPVLLLVDEKTNDASGESGVEAGARRVLRRPFHAALLEGAIQDLLEERSRRLLAGSGADSLPAASQAMATALRLQEAEKEGSTPPGRESRELPWLRFFLKGTRLLRAGVAGSGELARLAQEELGPETVGLMTSSGGATSLRLELRGGADMALLKQVIEASEGREAQPAAFAIDFSAGVEKGWLVLLGLSPAARESAEEYREDVRCLLGEWMERVRRGMG